MRVPRASRIEIALLSAMASLALLAACRDVLGEPPLVRAEWTSGLAFDQPVAHWELAVDQDRTGRLDVAVALPA